MTCGVRWQSSKLRPGKLHRYQPQFQPMVAKKTWRQPPIYRWSKPNQRPKRLSLRSQRSFSRLPLLPRQNPQLNLLLNQLPVCWPWRNASMTSTSPRASVNATRLLLKRNVKRTAWSQKHKRHPVRPLKTLKNARPFWNAKSKNSAASNVTTVHDFVHLSKTNSKISIRRHESQNNFGATRQRLLRCLCHDNGRLFCQ